MGFQTVAFASYAGNAARAGSIITTPAHTSTLNSIMHPIIRQPAHITATSKTAMALSPPHTIMDLDPQTTVTTLHTLWDTTSMHLANAASAAVDPHSYNSFFGTVRTEVHDLAVASEQHAMAMESSPMVPTKMAEESLEAVGHDLLLFLAASVVVDPLAKILGVAPVLLYLILGFVAGPYGLSLFSSGTDVNSEIGDFGILFLLFVEGLQLSPERLKRLGSFFSLGLVQLLLSVGGIFFLFFFGGPYILPIVQDVRVPIDPYLFQLLEKPVVAFSIAAAGALSSSAFVLPILKEKGWEKRPDGIAALAILLLQDLAVAPLLVLLPLIAEYDRNGGSIQDPAAIGILAAKATLGFGSVLALASVILRQIFQVVASYGSSQTFVAASLLVAVGMGLIADDLGLSSTTGAFAAGVLLAESGYRAQIEADIKPFEGILLGVFFVTAGASLDPLTCIDQWPTLLAGIATFISIKLAIIFAAGSTGLGLTRAESARVALLLAGGGEFAFVVFKLAKDLDVLPDDLANLLTASVVISMSLTPILGIFAEIVGDKLDELDRLPEAINGESVDYDLILTDEKTIKEAFEIFDDDGNGSISVEELQKVLRKPGTTTMLSINEVKAVMAKFDDNGDNMLQFDEFAALWTGKRRAVIGDVATNGGNQIKIQSSISNAVVVCGYGQVGQALCTAMDDANRAGIGGGISYVAFSCQPDRISAGVMNGASVVYGDGASPSLIRASGVESPSAFAICYSSDSQCQAATLRLRDAYPKVPIYVRVGRREMVEPLMKAGATEVVVETDKVAEAMRTLVSRYGDTSMSLMKAALWSTSPEGREVGETLPFTDLVLADLAFECDKTPEELKELYELFSTSQNKNEDGLVLLQELRDLLMKQQDQIIDDKALAQWMGYEEALSKWVTGDAESIYITFPDFVRFSARKLEKEDA